MLSSRRFSISSNSSLGSTPVEGDRQSTVSEPPQYHVFNSTKQEGSLISTADSSPYGTDASEGRPQLRRSRSLYGIANWEKSNRCHICDVKFGMLGKKRHHCRFCGKSVCGPHSMKKYAPTPGDPPVRICDKCDRKAEENKYIRKISEKLEKVGDETARAMEKYSVCKDEVQKKNDMIAQMTHELQAIEAETRQIETSLTDKLKNEQQRYDESQNRIDKLQKQIGEASAQDSSMSEQSKEIELEIKKVKEEVEIATGQQEELRTQIDYFNLQLRTKVPYEETIKIVWEEWKDRIKELFRPSHGRLDSVSEAAWHDEYSQIG